MKAAEDTQRPARDPWDIGFGAVTLVITLLTITVWIPNDIKGGFIEINHIGKPEPGDAFFPIILASLILVLSAGQLIGAVFNRKAQPTSGRLSQNNLKFIFLFYAIVFAGLAVIYWVGPLVVEISKMLGILDHDTTYRQLVDTAPYKYFGYIVGGFAMTMALITWVEGVVRPRAIWTVIIVLASLILILDILLQDILLPPNSDF